MKMTHFFMAGAIAAFSVAASAQSDTSLGAPDYRTMWAQNDDNYNRNTDTEYYNSTTTTTETDETHGVPGRLYYGQELVLAFFGTASLNEEILESPSGARVHQDGRLGAGAGGDLFFTRWFGIGGDAWTENTSGNFIDDASGRVIVRFPVDEIHLAPYIFGGGGYQFDTARAPFLHAGAGLDIRVCRNFGLFVDGRYVWPKKIEGFGLGRAGVYIAF